MPGGMRFCRRCATFRCGGWRRQSSRLAPRRCRSSSCGARKTWWFPLAASRYLVVAMRGCTRRCMRGCVVGASWLLAVSVVVLVQRGCAGLLRLPVCIMWLVLVQSHPLTRTPRSTRVDVRHASSQRDHVCDSRVWPRLDPREARSGPAHHQQLAQVRVHHPVMKDTNRPHHHHSPRFVCISARPHRNSVVVMGRVYFWRMLQFPNIRVQPSVSRHCQPLFSCHARRVCPPAGTVPRDWRVSH